MFVRYLRLNVCCVDSETQCLLCRCSHKCIIVELSIGAINIAMNLVSRGSCLEQYLFTCISLKSSTITNVCILRSQHELFFGNSLWLIEKLFL